MYASHFCRGVVLACPRLAVKISCEIRLDNYADWRLKKVGNKKAEVENVLRDQTLCSNFSSARSGKKYIIAGNAIMTKASGV